MRWGEYYASCFSFCASWAYKKVSQCAFILPWIISPYVVCSLSAERTRDEMMHKFTSPHFYVKSHMQTSFLSLKIITAFSGNPDKWMGVCNLSLCFLSAHLIWLIILLTRSSVLSMHVCRLIKTTFHLMMRASAVTEDFLQIPIPLKLLLSLWAVRRG